MYFLNVHYWTTMYLWLLEGLCLCIFLAHLLSIIPAVRYIIDYSPVPKSPHTIASLIHCCPVSWSWDTIILLNYIHYLFQFGSMVLRYDHITQVDANYSLQPSSMVHGPCLFNYLTRNQNYFFRKILEINYIKKIFWADCLEARVAI